VQERRGHAPCRCPSPFRADCEKEEEQRTAETVLGRKSWVGSVVQERVKWARSGTKVQAGLLGRKLGQARLEGHAFQMD
jgi:hypothetical protein